MIDEGTSYSKWNVNCTYDRNIDVDQNNSSQFTVDFYPDAEEFELVVEEEFELQIQAFDFYNYTTQEMAMPLSFPVYKYFIDTLHFEIAFNDTALPGQSDRFHLLTETCWATPAYGQISSKNATLIENNCPSYTYSSIVELIDPRNETNTDHWNTRVFRFENEGDDVSIRCRVKICYDVVDCLRNCTGVNTVPSRKRRNAGLVVEKEVSSGMIRLLGENEEIESVDDESENNGVYLVSFGALIMSCLLVLSVL